MAKAKDEVMQMNPVGWFEIYVDDIKRAKAFYEKVFDVELEALNDPSDGSVEMLAGISFIPAMIGISFILVGTVIINAFSSSMSH